MDTTELQQQFETTLRQRADNFRGQLDKTKREILARNSAAGRLRSGATLRELAEAFDKGLAGFCSEVFSLTHSWQILDGLNETELRKSASEFVRQMLSDIPDKNFVSYGGPSRESADEAIAKLISEAKSKALIEIRNFELGVGQPIAAASPTYVINAQTIVGGIQQGSTGSTQINTVAVSIEELSQATADIITELLASGQAEMLNAVEADMAKLKAELSKPEPDRAILREAARSVKSVVEGAFGGMIATAMTPQFIAALQTLAAFAG